MKASAIAFYLDKIRKGGPESKQEEVEGVVSVPVHTKGGDLEIRFVVKNSTTSNTSFHDVYLCGPAKLVFRGKYTF